MKFTPGLRYREKEIKNTETKDNQFLTGGRAGHIIQSDYFQVLVLKLKKKRKKEFTDLCNKGQKVKTKAAF